MGVVFGGFSMVTTGSYTLGLNDSERSELGEALHETLANFPASSPFVQLINTIAPWAKLVDGTAKALWRRLVYLRENRIPKPVPPPPPRPQVVPQVPNADRIYAPDPARI